MPEVVSSFIVNNDFTAAREIQKNIILKMQLEHQCLIIEKKIGLQMYHCMRLMH